MRRVCIAFLLGTIAVGLTSCSDSPAQPDATPTPVPPSATPPPTPNAGPTPKPHPIPQPAPGNTNPVAKVSAKIEMVTCGGEPIKSNTSFDVVKVGCKMFFDTTPKDLGNNRTTPEGIPEWTFSPGHLVSVNLIDPFTPVVTAEDNGLLLVSVMVDGVKSRDIEVKLIH
jgi:hypothetical protein